MLGCEYCGAELPDHARFCSSCGRTLIDGIDWPTHPSSDSGVDGRSLTLSVHMSDYPVLEQGQQGLDVTANRPTPEDALIENSAILENRQSDESKVIPLDLLLLAGK